MTVSIKEMKKKKEELTYSLCIRFTQKTIKDLATIAKKEDVPVSDIVRKAVIKAIPTYR